MVSKHPPFYDNQHTPPQKSPPKDFPQRYSLIGNSVESTVFSRKRISIGPTQTQRRWVDWRGILEFLHSTKRIQSNLDGGQGSKPLTLQGCARLSFLLQFDGWNSMLLRSLRHFERIDPLSLKIILHVNAVLMKGIPAYVVWVMTLVWGRKYHSTRNSTNPNVCAIIYLFPLLNRNAKRQKSKVWVHHPESLQKAYISQWYSTPKNGINRET